MTISEVTEVEYDDKATSTSGTVQAATFTQPLPIGEIARAIGDVVARVDCGYAIDLVTSLQVRARMATDNGERLSLDEFAEAGGWTDDLARLRAE